MITAHTDIKNDFCTLPIVTCFKKNSLQCYFMIERSKTNSCNHLHIGNPVMKGRDGGLDPTSVPAVTVILIP